MFEDVNGTMVPGLTIQQELYREVNYQVQAVNTLFGEHDSISPVGYDPTKDTAEEDARLSALLAEFGL